MTAVKENKNDLKIFIYVCFRESAQWLRMGTALSEDTSSAPNIYMGGVAHNSTELQFLWLPGAPVHTHITYHLK